MKWYFVWILAVTSLAACGGSPIDSQRHGGPPWIAHRSNDDQTPQIVQETTEDCTAHQYLCRANCVAGADAWRASDFDGSYFHANGHAFTATGDCMYHCNVHLWQCAGK